MNRLVRWGILAVFTVITLVPFAWLTLSSFKTNAELFGSPFSLPANWSLSNYAEAFAAHPMPVYFRNSIIAAGGSTLLAIFAASLAAYALLHVFRLRRVVYVYLVFGLFLPVSALMAPVFFIVHFLGLYNSPLALVLVYAAISLPLSFLVVKGYMDSIPEEILEAAVIDGASFFGRFRLIVLPLALPGIATAAIFLLITAWNELLFARLLTQDEASQTVQVGIRYFLTTYAADYPLAFAATVSAILPTILVYIFLSDRVVEGMTAGAVK